MIELFKDIPNYEGLYQVSNLGNVKSLSRISFNGKQLKERIMTKSLNTDGYYRVQLSKDYKSKAVEIHRLMAYAFLNHIPQGTKQVVDHIDNNRSNNKLDNLQIVSFRVNTTKDINRGKNRFLGVSLENGKYRASISINGKKTNLGSYNCELRAHLAYLGKRKEIESCL